MEIAVYKEGDGLATKFGVSKKTGEDIKPSEPLIVFRVEVTIYVQYTVYSTHRQFYIFGIVTVNVPRNIENSTTLFYV